jgi:NitT/TauT family transport system substrate-binding protein
VKKMMKLSFRVYLGLIVIILAILVMAGCQKTEAVPSPSGAPIKIGALSMMTMLPLFVAQQENLFQAQGVNVEIVPFASVIDRDTAFHAGQLDCIVDDVFSGVLLNKEQPTVQVVAVSAVQSPMFYVIVSNQSQAKQVSDLKNVEIAVSLKTIIEYATEKMLISGGLTSADIKLISIPSMPLRLEMMNQNKLNAGTFSRPLADAAVLSGNKVICDDSQNTLLTSSIMFGVNVIKNRPGDIKKFLKAWDLATKNISDKPDQYNGLLIQSAKISDTVAKSIKVPKFNALRALKDADFQPKAEWLLNKGVITQKPTLSDIATSSYLPK